MRTVSEPPQDIIQFYNAVFIPAMKDHLLSVCAVNHGPSADAATSGGSMAPPMGGAAGAAGGGGSTSQTLGGSVSPDISSARGGASPRHVSAGAARDVWVRERSTPNAHLTPRTRTLFAFPDTPAASSSSNLKDINSNLNAPAGSDVAHTLSNMGGASSGVANGAAHGPGAANGAADGAARRGQLDLSQTGGSSVMASGQKRSRVVTEPSRSSTPGDSSADGDSAPADSRAASRQRAA